MKQQEQRHSFDALIAVKPIVPPLKSGHRFAATVTMLFQTDPKGHRARIDVPTSLQTEHWGLDEGTARQGALDGLRRWVEEQGGILGSVP